MSSVQLQTALVDFFAVSTAVSLSCFGPFLLFWNATAVDSIKDGFANWTAGRFSIIDSTTVIDC